MNVPTGMQSCQQFPQDFRSLVKIYAIYSRQHTQSSDESVTDVIVIIVTVSYDSQIHSYISDWQWDWYTLADNMNDIINFYY